MRSSRLLLSVALCVAPASALADQLQCNEKGIAEAALALFPKGSVFVDFCSLCEAKAQVVRVTDARVVEDCDFELEVTGDVIAETTVAFSDGYVPGKASYVSTKSPVYRQRIDLAYAYVEVGDNDFRWIGGQLGLQATVNTASIQLPKDVYGRLGAHARPAVAAPVEVKVRQPSVAEVQRVFGYFRGGADGAVLGHLTPCLKLDMKRSSPSRYECAEPVQGAVAAGTQVYAWTDWLVPRGTTDKAAIQFIKDGEVRLERPIDLKARAASPIVPATAGAKLSQVGVYTLRVVRAGETLAETSVEVRK